MVIPEVFKPFTTSPFEQIFKKPEEEVERTGVSRETDEPSIPVGITAEKLVPFQVIDPVGPDVMDAAPPCDGTDVGNMVQLTPTAGEL